MSEKMLEVYDFLDNDKNYLLCLIKKEKCFIIEKSYFVDHKLCVLFNKKYYNYEKSKNKFNYLKKVLWKVFFLCKKGYDIEDVKLVG